MWEKSSVRCKDMLQLTWGAAPPPPDLGVPVIIEAADDGANLETELPKLWMCLYQRVKWGNDWGTLDKVIIWKTLASAWVGSKESM